jgi:hypothetical protein
VDKVTFVSKPLAGKMLISKLQVGKVPHFPKASDSHLHILIAGFDRCIGMDLKWKGKKKKEKKGSNFLNRRLANRTRLIILEVCKVLFHLTNILKIFY